jgi:hypothetical protein
MEAYDNKSTNSTVSEFERTLKKQHDLIYGVALLFECIGIMYAEQPAIMETYRKQFRNIIHKGREDCQHGESLLEAAKNDPKRITELQGVEFAAFEATPDGAQFKIRAAALMEAYNELFPDRPRSQEFTRNETLQLIDRASQAFTQLD